ncbi:YdeI/OmpD-associated family protein [Fictibacillus aquaticus]|uniref:LAAC n=1 Tax=Fictibacillus aquaticus TaxID=2021314 RepID=A0A235F8J9_9BACL|nr:YdeI/OmpD-associated family protein [Fictibacillus aquaticus]OYD57572.1 hypothetical protein CGZ90_12955 [Fictibacillus aquaticus]
MPANSTKSVAEKLNFAKYPTKLILNMPANNDDFAEIDYDSVAQKDQYSLVFIFVFSIEEMKEHLSKLIDKQLVEDNGYVFFAYPKKNNPQYKEFIERDSFYGELNPDEDGYVAGSSLKFSRMVSLNDVFTVVGLKSAKKKASKSAAKSQCVADYIVHVEDIKRYLAKNDELLQKYNDLTFGYQKDWARYVYSAKREETQQKRLAEMETIIGEGYKSMDLYRRRKN